MQGKVSVMPGMAEERKASAQKQGNLMEMADGGAPRSAFAATPHSTQRALRPGYGWENITVSRRPWRTIKRRQQERNRGNIPIVVNDSAVTAPAQDTPDTGDNIRYGNGRDIAGREA